MSQEDVHVHPDPAEMFDLGVRYSHELARPHSWSHQSFVEQVAHQDAFAVEFAPVQLVVARYTLPVPEDQLATVASQLEPGVLPVAQVPLGPTGH